eukprot:gene5361-5597_t
MQRPFRSSRKQDVVSSLLADDAPLDVSEQQQIIKGLEQEQENLQKWKLLFAAVAGTFGSWFIYAAIQQHVHPYEQRYTGELQASVQRFGMENGAHWELLWLPFGPPMLAGLCWYVDCTIEATAHEVQQLKWLMYDHKKV